MNEQIEKLAELSGFKQDMLNIGIWYSPEFQKFAERFAELIVKDCACVPTDMWGEGELDVHTAVQVHRRILAHFDVA